VASSNSGLLSTDLYHAIVVVVVPLARRSGTLRATPEIFAAGDS
jgi:hypothetical protein